MYHNNNKLYAVSIGFSSVLYYYTIINYNNKLQHNMHKKQRRPISNNCRINDINHNVMVEIESQLDDFLFGRYLHNTIYIIYILYRYIYYKYFILLLLLFS